MVLTGSSEYNLSPVICALALTVSSQVMASFVSTETI